MKNKIIAFTISLVITVASFLLIIYIEDKLFNPNGTTSVYVVNEDKLDKGYVISEGNFDKLFKLEKRRTDQIPPYYIKEKQDVYNYYLKQDIYKNEILAADKVENVDNELKDIIDRREVTINGENTANVAGGILREGDKADLVATTTKGNMSTSETKIKNAYISRVYDSSGVPIDKGDKTKIALTITFIVSSTDAEEIKNSTANGSWSLVKVLEN